MSKLLFIEKVQGDKSAYASKVERISSNLGFPANWLQFLIDFESAGTFSSSKTNSYGCVGLIQFCPDQSGGSYKTINGVKYNMAQIGAMSNVEQLDLVYEYLKEKQKVGGKFYSFYDLYLAILWPNAIGQSDDYVITTSTNPAFDISPKDGIITVREVKKFLDERVAKVVPLSFQNEFKKKVLFCKSIKESLLLEA